MIFAEEDRANALAANRPQIELPAPATMPLPMQVVDDNDSNHRRVRLRWRNAFQKFQYVKRWGQGPNFAKAIGILGGDENDTINTRLK